MTTIRLLIVIATMLSLTGCWFRSKPKAQTPPAAPAQVPRSAQTRPATAAPKAQAKRRPAAPAPRAAQPAAIPPKAAEVRKTVIVPKAEETQHLGRILSPEERSRYQSMYEQSASAARDMLRTLSGRELASGQRDSIGRIRSFLAQAQEASASDWTAAAQLAYRAEILARDLVRLLQ